MLYKEDWDKVMERFEGLWRCEIVDRCCVAVKAPKGGRGIDWSRYGRPADHEGLARYYRDPEAVLERHIALFENTYFGGEALPSLCPYWGWNGGAIYFKGAEYRYAQDTIWVFPIVRDWETDELLFENEGGMYKSHLRFIERLADEAKGKFLLAMPDFVGGVDALINVRGVSETLLDMVDKPERFLQGLKIVRDAMIQFSRESYDIIKNADDGGSAVEWFNTWAPGHHNLVQCDHSALLSPEMFERHSLPDLEACCEALDYPAYHLDGEAQIRHLDMILSVSKIKLIQWTNVAGQPEVLNYIPIFKRIQRAGKALLLFCCMNEVETLLTELSPKGLFLNVEGAASEGEARDMIRKVGGLTRNVRSGLE